MVVMTADGKAEKEHESQDAFSRDAEVLPDGGTSTQEPSRESTVETTTRAESVEDEDAEALVTPEDDIEPTVSVVLPTMNEEAGIEKCIDHVLEGIVELGLTAEIVVSDSSSDRTPELARARGARVVTPDQEGYGYAYRYGFQHVRGDYVVMGDADTTYDFRDLPRLFEPILRGEADIVMGSRLEGEIKPGAMPALHRYVGNPLLTKFLNLFYDAGVSDAHSGFRVFRAEALETLDLQSNGMEFASEIVMEASIRDLTIAEVPITYHEREGEATLSSFRDGWRHVKFMLTNAPGYLFTVPAAFMIAAGTLLIAISFFNLRLAGLTFATHTTIAGFLFTIIGVQTGILSVFTAVAADPIREPSDPVTRWITDNFCLEHGATLGAMLFAIGAIYASNLIYQWVSSGYTTIPFVPGNMLAATLMVLGVETVFSSFHLSMLIDSRDSAGRGESRA